MTLKGFGKNLITVLLMFIAVFVIEVLSASIKGEELTTFDLVSSSILAIIIWLVLLISKRYKE